jgi:hypothetical protein
MTRTVGLCPKRFAVSSFPSFPVLLVEEPSVDLASLAQQGACQICKAIAMTGTTAP